MTVGLAGVLVVTVPEDFGCINNSLRTSLTKSKDSDWETMDKFDQTTHTC
jgi:hypothetical protein